MSLKKYSALHLTTLSQTLKQDQKLMRRILFIYSGALLLSLDSCYWTDKILCGEPTGQLKQFIDSINIKFSGKLELNQVPCYPGYAEIILQEGLNAPLLDSLEKEIKNHDFVEVLVYDKENVLIRGNIGSM